MSYGKVFQLLKKTFINEWELYVNHDFIRKLRWI